jgi:hypothetical protein
MVFNIPCINGIMWFGIAACYCSVDLNQSNIDTHIHVSTHSYKIIIGCPIIPEVDCVGKLSIGQSGYYHDIIAFLTDLFLSVINILVFHCASTLMHQEINK